MGCSCYANRADAAQIKKDELLLEKQKYIDAASAVSSLSSSAGSYKSFFSNLAPALDLIVVNHQTFSADECRQHASAMDGVVSDLNQLASDINKVLPKIDKEIQAQNTIISQRNYTCSYHSELYRENTIK